MRIKGILKCFLLTIATVLLLVFMTAGVALWLVFKSDTPAKIVNGILSDNVPVYANLGKVSLSLKSVYPFFALHVDNILVKEDAESADTIASIDYLDLMVNLKLFAETRQISVQKLWLGPSCCNIDLKMLQEKFSSGEEKENQLSLFGGNIYADLSLFKWENVDLFLKPDADSLSDCLDLKDMSVTLHGCLKSDTINAQTVISIPYIAYGESVVRNLITDVDINMDSCAVVCKASVKSGETKACLDTIMASVFEMYSNIDVCYNLLEKHISATSDLKLNYMQAMPGNGIFAGADNLEIVCNDIDAWLSDSLKLSLNVFVNAQNLQAGISADSLNVNARCNGLQFTTSVNVSDNFSKISANPEMCFDRLTVDLNGERYADSCPLNVLVQAELDGSHFTVNNLNLTVDGNRMDLKVTGNLKPSLFAYAALSCNELDLEKLLSLVPDCYKNSLDGIMAAGSISLNADTYISDSDNGLSIDPQSAMIVLKDFSGGYSDFIDADGKLFSVNVVFPNYLNGQDAVLIKTLSKSSHADVNLSGSMLKADIDSLNAYFYLYDLMNIMEMPRFESYAYMTESNISFDTISAKYDQSSILLDIYDPFGEPNGYVDTYFDGFSGSVGSDLSVLFNHFGTQLDFYCDKSRNDLLLRWNPYITTILEQAKINYRSIPVEIEKTDFDFNLGRFDIYDASVTVGRSDLNVTGYIENLGDYLLDKDTLRGDLNIKSDVVDLSQIMVLADYLNDSDGSDTIAAAAVDSIMESEYNGPYMVPDLVNLSMNTMVDTVIFNNGLFNNLKGDITFHNGSLIVQEMGFSSDAARMQLTAKYQTPERNNLFAALDFHLLDIQIKHLIDLIPAIDSIMPMLKSFDGEAQFHLAVESSFDSLYMPKFPTTIGAMAIEGKDLVVMDNDVFKTIKKRLLMSKKAENKIDSLNVEMQLLRNRVDLYPFLLKMDRYQAVLGGRHNINKDLDCRYHVSLTKSPLPFRLGVTVKGSINDIVDRPLKHIKLSKCEYKRLYVPERRNLTDERVLMMKQDILNTLKSSVNQ